MGPMEPNTDVPHQVQGFLKWRLVPDRSDNRETVILVIGNTPHKRDTATRYESSHTVGIDMSVGDLSRKRSRPGSRCGSSICENYLC